MLTGDDFEVEGEVEDEADNDDGDDDDEHKNGCTRDENDDRVDVIDVKEEGHWSQEELEINWQLVWWSATEWIVADADAAAVAGDESLVTSCLQASLGR